MMVAEGRGAGFFSDVTEEVPINNLPPMLMQPFLIKISGTHTHTHTHTHTQPESRREFYNVPTSYYRCDTP